MGPRPYHGTMPSQTSSTDTEPFPRYQEPPQTQPIDIPAGNPAIQSRTHYTGDAFDITSVDARQYLNPSRQQLGSTSYSSNDLSGSATVTGTTYAGSSQAGPIANVTAAPTLPRSRRTESSATSNQADKGKNVAAARVPAQGTNTNARNSLYEMLARYPMKDLRAVFPGRSDSFIREKLGLAPGTPTDPYYGREYAEHAKAGTASTSDDREFVRGNYDQEEDPFTGVPDRSNLLFSASGHFLPGVVAASTPPRMPQPPPSRPPPLPPQPAPAAASAATRASEIIEELDRLAVADPTVVSLLRASGYRGGGAPSSGSSAAATAAAAAPFLTSSLSAGGPLVQGELLHQRDERARAERLERRQARLVKKASKATLKSQNSVGGGGGAGLFGRFRRANEGGGGPSAPSA